MGQDAQRLLPRGMAGLSRSFYETSYDLTAAMERGAPQAVKTPSAVIILVTACLEAYLSEFLAFNRQIAPDRFEAAIEELDRQDPETRWLKAPLIFGSETFDPGTEPFQSFKGLISLRNSL